MGYVESQLGMACEILHQLEIAQDGRHLTPDETILKNLLKKRSLMLSSLKRMIAHSRSRIGWLREGDANTNFFHMLAIGRENFIGKLVSEGMVCSNHEDKAKLVEDSYRKLLGISWMRDHSIDLQALGMPTHTLGLWQL